MDMEELFRLKPIAKDVKKNYLFKPLLTLWTGLEQLELKSDFG